MFHPYQTSGAKYRNVHQAYNGRTYHSRREAAYAAELDLLRKAKTKSERVVDVKAQVNVDLVVNGKKICRYIPDFEVTYGDGRVELHEIKGFETNEFKLKEKLFRALFPKRVLKVIR